MKLKDKFENVQNEQDIIKDSIDKLSLIPERVYNLNVNTNYINQELKNTNYFLESIRNTLYFIAFVISVIGLISIFFLGSYL